MGKISKLRFLLFLRFWRQAYLNACENTVLGALRELAAVRESY